LSVPNELFNKLGRATNDVERAKVKPYNYASIVGALLYVAVLMSRHAYLTLVAC
jgi:hypothetical protein